MVGGVELTRNLRASDDDPALRRRIGEAIAALGAEGNRLGSAPAASCAVRLRHLAARWQRAMA